MCVCVCVCECARVYAFDFLSSQKLATVNA